jgi:CMP-N,N'-diacetyllegionaminic acid synthase
MCTLAVIIARAGSKGLANKSIQLLRGRPLVTWTIEHALGSRRVDHVVLSSDCPKTLAEGDRLGIETYRRPQQRADDAATIDDAARHGVECWEQRHGRACCYVAILYGNIPLRPTDLTDRAVAKLIETGADSVQGVYPVGKMHPLWMRRLGGPGADELEMYEPNSIYRRQDLPPLYMLSGGALVVTRSSLFEVDPDQPHAFLGADRRAIVHASCEVVDVDEALDLAFAEALLSQARGG